jgi:hypothetical protein
MTVAFAVRVSAGLPPVALTVNGNVAWAAVRATVRVRVVDDPVAGLGEKFDVIPAGNPLTDIFSGELKPPVREMATV